MNRFSSISNSKILTTSSIKYLECKPLLVALYTAFKFMTCLTFTTSSNIENENLIGSMHVFPLIGLVIGSIGAIFYFISSLLLPSTISTIFAITVIIVITKARHENEFAHIVNEVCNNSSIFNKKKPTNKDHRNNNYYGIIALILCLLLKFFVIIILSTPSAISRVLIITNVISISSIPLTMQLLSIFHIRMKSEFLTENINMPSSRIVGIGTTIALIIATIITTSGITFVASIVTILAVIAMIYIVLYRIDKSIMTFKVELLCISEQIAEISTLLSVITFHL
ncbi:MAG: adenosylcobinamide-GDP ribazoletransferase [Rhodospirillaceae bacterium]|nr:adenosylcobinamide-GDP ribazoletransferase [Rhodospirillaceae bacterium]